MRITDSSRIVIFMESYSTARHAPPLRMEVWHPHSTSELGPLIAVLRLK